MQERRNHEDMHTRQAEVVRYRENWLVSTAERMNSTTTTARDNASARQRSMATKQMYAKIDSSIANEFQTIAMLRCEAKNTAMNRGWPTKRQKNNIT